MASMLIALGSKALASYPEGAAMAVGFLQYPLGLRALGHQVAWIELISAAQLQAQPGLAAKFFALMARYGLAQDSVLVAVEDLDHQEFERDDGGRVMRIPAHSQKHPLPDDQNGQIALLPHGF